MSLEEGNPSAQKTTTSTGQVNAIMIPRSQLASEEMIRAVKLESDQLSALIDLARKEYKRLESTPLEFYLALANPPSITLSENDVDRIMSALGSKKELSGAWPPVIFSADGDYFRIWGKTAYCG